MTKTNPTDTSPTTTESPPPADTTPETTAAQSFWRLKEGKAPKLGARAEGSINYNVLADNDRQQLFIAITGNKGGGYFSKEHVDITKIEACLDASTSTKPFPSKTFKEAFVGRSSNNAGFWSPCCAMKVCSRQRLKPKLNMFDLAIGRHGKNRCSPKPES